MLRQGDLEGATPLKLLVDTTVWMDYFLVRQESHREAAELVRLAFGSEDVALYVASLSLKDLSHLLESVFRRDARAATGEVSDRAAAAPPSLPGLRQGLFGYDHSLPLSRSAMVLVSGNWSTPRTFFRSKTLPPIGARGVALRKSVG